MKKQCKIVRLSLGHC